MHSSGAGRGKLPQAMRCEAVNLRSAWKKCICGLKTEHLICIKSKTKVKHTKLPHKRIMYSDISIVIPSFFIYKYIKAQNIYFACRIVLLK